MSIMCRLMLLSAMGLWVFLRTNGCALAGETTHPTAFIHANLIPMTTESVLFDHTLIVAGNRIAAVGPSDQIKIPPNAKVVNCAEAYLMPGLADMHMHLRKNWISDRWPVSPLKLYLANGVTTIRCFGPRGKTGQYALKWKQDIDSGRLCGPQIITCGPQLRGHFRENPEHMVIKQKYQSFDFIKIYSYVTKQEYHTIVSTAKKLNIYTAGHIPFQVGLDGILAEGMDEIAHIEELLWELIDFDRQRYFAREADWMAYVIRTSFGQLRPYLDMPSHQMEQKVAAFLKAISKKLESRKIPVCSTLVVDDVIVQKLLQPSLFLNRPENRYFPEGYLDQFHNGREKHQMQFKGAEVFAPLKYRLDKKLLTTLKEIEVPIVLSTDAGTGGMGIVPGFSIHDELRILVENGFTPYEAIATGTVVASKIVNRMVGRDDFGAIAPGKRADLVLLRKNPLEDVANAHNIQGVMANGRWYDRKAIEAMLEQSGKKPILY